MVYIIVEGKEDIHFIDYLLSEKLKIDQQLYEIGYNKSHGIGSSKLRHLEEFGSRYTKIIIINDADNDFHARYNEIKKKLDSKALQGEIFLFPNNKDKGELENLLCDCIPEDKNVITTCFSSFQDCLRKKKSDLPNIPAVKGKVYTYVDVQLNKDERESRNNPKACKCRDKKDCLCKNQYCFSKDSIWNFECEEIQPLLDFLRKYVK